MKTKTKPILVVIVNQDGSLGKVFQRKTMQAAIEKATDEAWDLDQGIERSEIYNWFDDTGATEWNTGDNGRVVITHTEED